VGVSRSDPFNEGAEAARARRRRNYAIALGLVAFFVLVFATTALRLRQNIQAPGGPAAAPAGGAVSAPAATAATAVPAAAAPNG
jgi:hypothetical protein